MVVGKKGEEGAGGDIRKGGEGEGDQADDSDWD
jgi:hypothetical protein